MGPPPNIFQPGQPFLGAPQVGYPPSNMYLGGNFGFPEQYHNN